MYIDFDELKRRVRIEDVASDMLGLALKNDHGNFRAACPTCDSGDRAIHIDAKAQLFCCHAAPKQPNGKTYGGDVIRLTSHILGIKSMNAAAQKIVEHFGEPAPQQRTVQRTAPPAPPKKVELEGRRGIESVRDRLAFEHEQVQVLGLSPAAAEALGVGYMAKGTMPNRVLFPIRTDKGELLAYCGIAVEDGQEARFKFPKNFEEEIEAKVIPFASRTGTRSAG